MNVLGGRGRLAAAGGLFVATAAATTMAVLAGSSQAAPTAENPGTCNDTVKVHKEANLTSPPVGTCHKNEKVSVSERRSGFLHVHTTTDRADGWIRADFVDVGSAGPSGSAAPVAPDASNTPSSSASTTSSRPARSSTSSSRPRPSASRSSSSTPAAAARAADPAPVNDPAVDAPTTTARHPFLLG